MTTRQIARQTASEIARDALREREELETSGRQFKRIECATMAIANAVLDYLEQRRPDWRMGYETSNFACIRVVFPGCDC